MLMLNSINFEETCTRVQLLGPQKGTAQAGIKMTTPVGSSGAAVAVEFPPYRVSQQEMLSHLTGCNGPQFERFTASSGVQTRRLALPLPRLGMLSGFTEANDAFIDVALDLGERALLSAL